MIFLFDMGGVLANSSGLEVICNKLGISQESFINNQFDEFGNKTYHSLTNGLISTEAYWQNFSRNYGKQITEDYFTTCYDPLINYELKYKIETLRKNYRVICGTNTIESHHNVHKSRGNYDVFDYVYSSHLLGVKKPAAEFFIEILNAEDTIPKNVFFVDDREDNISIANEMGFNTHLYTTNDLLFDSLDSFIDVLS